MRWIITRTSNNLADLSLVTYSFNVTQGTANIFPVRGSWTVDIETRQIIQATPGMGMTGRKNPFWIDSSTRTGSTIDAYFGTYATVQQVETIQVLGQSVSCWKVSMTWPTSSMQSWYDPATGIVLRIDSGLMSSGISMHVVETAAGSNIAMIGSGTTSPSPVPWPYLGIGIVAAVGVSLSVGYIYKRRRTIFRLALLFRDFRNFERADLQSVARKGSHNV